MEDPDTALMMRFKGGDSRAFEELVRRNTAIVHALVYRFLSDPDQVDDVTQEVFLRVYRAAKNYQPSAKFSTWLYRIVANLSFNVMRSRRHVPLTQLQIFAHEEDDAPRDDIPDCHEPTPAQYLGALELNEKVAQAVEGLPDTQRFAIVLNKYEHKSLEEIANILDCSAMAVKSLLNRARANLRRSLGPYLGPSGEKKND